MARELGFDPNMLEYANVSSILQSIKESKFYFNIIETVFNSIILSEIFYQLDLFIVLNLGYFK